MQRRDFLQLSGATIIGALAFDLVACIRAKQKQKWGVGLFTVPQMLANDFKGTLKKIHDYGYSELEFFGPYPFSAEATKERWKGLAEQMGIKQDAFYGYSVSEVKTILDDNGLSAPSVHMDILTTRINMAPAMKELSQLGIKYCAIPALMDEPKETLDDYKRFAEEFNTFGKQMQEHGITFVYHNHGYEHAEKEGQVPLDYLLNNTDPDEVKFEMDIFWLQSAGASPVEYLTKYPGRFKLMHVKDASENVRFSGDGGSPDQWMAVFDKMADPGTGVFDIKGIVTAGIRSGVDHFFLERDLASDPETTLRTSIEYLKTIA